MALLVNPQGYGQRNLPPDREDLEHDLDGQQLLSPSARPLRTCVLCVAVGFASVGIPLLAAPGLTPPLAGLGFVVFGLAVYRRRSISLILLAAGAGYFGQWATGWPLAPALVGLLCTLHPGVRRDVFKRPVGGGGAVGSRRLRLAWSARQWSGPPGLPRSSAASTFGGHSCQPHSVRQRLLARRLSGWRS